MKHNYKNRQTEAERIVMALINIGVWAFLVVSALILTIMHA